jgi:hypothetical protein
MKLLGYFQVVRIIDLKDSCHIFSETLDLIYNVQADISELVVFSSA